jgi:pilus assembly protein TadC
MTAVLSVVLLGLVGGAAVTALLFAFTSERTDLVTALRQPRTPLLVGSGPASAVGEPGSGRPADLNLAQIQVWLQDRLERISWLRTPDKDLQILQMSRGTFLLNRVVAATAALLIGPLYTLVFGLIGLSLPFAATMLFGLIMAGLAWFAMGVLIHERAVRRRREMRYAMVGFLTLVALNRAAGRSMGQSLERAANSSRSWPFRMIGQRMAAAVRGGTSEWAGLAELSTELGVEELADIADIADLSSHAGAGVYSTLMARATSLRRELLARERESAAAASKNLALPRVLLTVTMAAFLIFPALLRLTST